MYLLVKRASAYSEDELASQGYIGIPANWPLETLYYNEGDEVPEGFEIMSEETLNSLRSSNLTAYNTWKNPPTLNTIVNNSIGNASDFGQNLIRQASIQNVLTGITQAGKTRDFTLYCHRLIHFLETGSLYGALDELNVLLADTSDAKTSLYPFLTDAKLNDYKTKILVYLGLA